MLLIYSEDLPTKEQLIRNNIVDCQRQLADWDIDDELLALPPKVRDNAKNGLIDNIKWWEKRLKNYEEWRSINASK